MLLLSSIVNVLLIGFLLWSAASAAVITFITPIAGQSKRNLAQSDENISAALSTAEKPRCGIFDRDSVSGHPGNRTAHCWISGVNQTFVESRASHSVHH